MCLGMGLFPSIWFGTLCASRICMSIYFTKLDKVSFIIFSNRFAFSCSFSLYPSGTPMMQMLSCLQHPEAPYTILVWGDSFYFLFVLIGYILLPYVSSLIWFSASSTPLLIPCNLLCISITVSFISAWIFYAVEVLIKFLEHPYNQCFEFCIW